MAVESTVRINVGANTTQAVNEFEKLTRTLTSTKGSIDSSTKSLNSLDESLRGLITKESISKVIHDLTSGASALTAFGAALTAVPGPVGLAGMAISGLSGYLDKLNSSTKAADQALKSYMATHRALWEATEGKKYRAGKEAEWAQMAVDREDLGEDDWGYQYGFGKRAYADRVRNAPPARPAPMRRGGGGSYNIGYAAIEDSPENAQLRANARLANNLDWSGPTSDGVGGAGWDSGALDKLEASQGAAIPTKRGPKRPGKADEFFSAFDTAGIKLGQDALNGLGNAFGAAVDAAISGSGGIAKAFAAVAKASLKSIAIQASINALFETAKGVASLALGPIGGVSAAGHFKAAALFAATAVAAGAASAAIPGGGGGASASAGGGPGGGLVRGGSGGGGDGGSHIVINVGQGFVGDPAKLGKVIHENIKEALRTGRVRDTSMATTSVH